MELGSSFAGWDGPSKSVPMVCPMTTNDLMAAYTPLDPEGGGGVLCINLDRDAHLRTFSVCPKK